jgi:hypothetical protein
LGLITTAKDTLVRTNRLLRLQERLDGLMFETRLLRERLELLVSAHEHALRQLSRTKRRSRPVNLKRAHRLF